MDVRKNGVSVRIRTFLVYELAIGRKVEPDSNNSESRILGLRRTIENIFCPLIPTDDDDRGDHEAPCALSTLSCGAVSGCLALHLQFG